MTTETTSGQSESSTAKWLLRAREDRWLAPLALVLIIGGCVYLPISQNLDDLWTATFQVAAAVAGAALGNALQLNRIAREHDRHATQSVRQLFDHLGLLRKVVEEVQSRREILARGDPMEHSRLDDWFASVEDSVRLGFKSGDTAVENWRDLAKQAVTEEIDNYRSRGQRLRVHE